MGLGNTYFCGRILDQNNAMKTVYSLVAATLLSITLLVQCRSDDPQAAEPTTAPKADTATLIAISELEAGFVDSVKMSMPKVEGYNYLTDCDSLLVSKLMVAAPDGSKREWYISGSCATNRSFELILVPRQNKGDSTALLDLREVLAKARANEFKDYIPYALIIPKVIREDVRSGTLNMKAILPTNVAVFRFDNPRWHQLGTETAEDEAYLNALRWKVVNDQPMLYPSI